MNKYTMTLLPQYFELIANGSKIYEVRLFKDDKRNIKIGDEITFYKRPDKIEHITVSVKEIILFSSFTQMAESLSHKEIGFESLSNEDIVKIYKEIYPSDEEEKNFGVVAFKIEIKIKINVYI